MYFTDLLISFLYIWRRYRKAACTQKRVVYALSCKRFQFFVNVEAPPYIPLTLVSHEKVLGVQLDKNLTWAEQINKVSNKMSTNVWLLSKIKRYLSVEHRVLFYKSNIQPHLDYANIVWGSAAKTNLMQIERLQ